MLSSLRTAVYRVENEFFEAQLEEHPDAKSLSGNSYFYHVKSSWKFVAFPSLSYDRFQNVPSLHKTLAF